MVRLRAWVAGQLVAMALSMQLAKLYKHMADVHANQRLP